MVELFLETPLELRILISGILGGWAWFMFREYRAEKKRQLRQRLDVIRPKPKLTLVKNSYKCLFFRHFYVAQGQLLMWLTLKIPNLLHTPCTYTLYPRMAVACTHIFGGIRQFFQKNICIVYVYCVIIHNLK